MKLLCTGSCGFIGSNFIHYMLKKYPDYKIINLDMLTYAGRQENLKGIEKNENYEFFRGDICAYGLVEELVGSVDAVVNFAAETHVDRSIQNSNSFVMSNIVGVHSLLEAIKKHKNIRAHFISTDEVFGSLNDGEPKFNERTSYNPLNPYSASKAAGDHLVRSYINTYKINATISNCSNNYGPRQLTEKFIPLAITNILNNKPIPVYGLGLNKRDWLYVEDHCSAIDLILHKGKIGETYCIGGDNEWRNIDIAEKIVELMGFDDIMIQFVTDRSGHDYRYAIDSSKIKNELGWKPAKTNFVDGLKETIEWYRNNF